MLNQPLLSVIIPCYQAKRFLLQCLNSLIDQNYNNLEIICAYTFCEDETLKILEEFQRQILNKPNIKMIILQGDFNGVSNARNAALQMAQGKYLCFIDADDYLIAKSRIFQKAISYMENHSQVDYFGFRSYLRIEKIRTLLPNVTVNNFHSTSNPIDFLTKNIMGFIWKAVYRMDVIKQNQITFDARIKLGEDILWTLEFFLKAQNFYFYKKFAHVYRWHDNNVSINKHKQKHTIINDQMPVMLEKCRQILIKTPTNQHFTNQKILQKIFGSVFWYNIFPMIGFEDRKLLNQRFQKTFNVTTQKWFIKHHLSYLVKIAKPKSLYQFFLYYFSFAKIKKRQSLVK